VMSKELRLLRVGEHPNESTQTGCTCRDLQARCCPALFCERVDQAHFMCLVPLGACTEASRGYRS